MTPTRFPRPLRRSSGERILLACAQAEALGCFVSALEVDGFTVAPVLSELELLNVREASMHAGQALAAVVIDTRYGDLDTESVWLIRGLDGEVPIAAIARPSDRARLEARLMGKLRIFDTAFPDHALCDYLGEVGESS